MIDFVLGLFLAGLLVRGWLRGFVREILDLIGLIAGLWIAIRLSAPFGDFLAESFAVTPEVARIAAGIGLFLLLGVALSVAAHYLSRVMSLPGLNLINRVGGAGVATAWGIALMVLMVNLMEILPIPDDWKGDIRGSTVVEAVAGPGSLAQSAFDALAGDNVLSALAAIQEVFGENRAVPEGDEQLSFPPADPAEIRQVREEAARVVSELNEFRAGEGVGAVQPSDAITRAAESRAASMYTSGVLARSPECLSPIRSAGARVIDCGEGLAMAGSTLGAFDGILDSETGRAELSDPDYDRTGVAVVDGPTGRLLLIYMAR